MHILPIHTPIIRAGDSVADIMMQCADIQPGDVLVISSKAIATAEGAAIDLSSMTPSHDATLWAQKTGKSAAFCQAVLQETMRMHGRVLGAGPGAMLTEVETDSATHSTMLVPNAGLDQSNIEDGFAVGWPLDPVRSVRMLSDAVHAPVIISDSCVHPRRWGVTAFALTVCGIDPIVSEIGKPDLFGHPLSITMEAVADQLSVAGNAVMGNAGQGNPATIIRDIQYVPSDFCGWVRGIHPDEDLFRGFI